MNHTNQRFDDCCEDGANPRAHRPQQDNSKGTPSSNTVPSTCIDSHNTEILRTGVDSLYLSYPGSLAEESAIKLTELKKLAQSGITERISLAQLPLSGHLFEVKDRGRHPFAYILADNHYRIELARLGANRTPLAHVQLSSEILTLHGVEASVGNLTEIIHNIGIIEDSPNVSRSDLCVDFVTDFDLASIIDAQWVTRAREFDRYTDQRSFSGWRIGSGSIKARLYNKTLEMKKKPRPYLEQIYADLGVKPGQDVWRLEFELRRETLRELNVKTFSELMKSLSGLWTYCTNNWLRLCEPSSTDKTQSRWPVMAFWQVLQSANWSGGDSLTRQEVEKGRPPCDRSLFVNGLSGLTSFMAREGIVDPIEGPHAFIQAARDFHDNRQYITGLDFVGYVNEKVKAKARAYNSYRVMPEHESVHPADKAAEQAYRKLSDGR